MSTNIAETSVTIEGVVYVIDCMFAKQKLYNPLTGLEGLLTAPISKASAVQRAGRAGRIRPGHCFRLCTESEYGSLSDVTVPEMQRCDLAPIVLQLKSLGVDNVMRFAWLAPPPAESMIRALELLHALGGLDDDARCASAGSRRVARAHVSCLLHLSTVRAMQVDAWGGQGHGGVEPSPSNGACSAGLAQVWRHGGGADSGSHAQRAKRVARVEGGTQGV